MYGIYMRILTPVSALHDYLSTSTWLVGWFLYCYKPRAAKQLYSYYRILVSEKD